MHSKFIFNFLTLLLVVTFSLFFISADIFDDCSIYGICRPANVTTIVNTITSGGNETLWNGNHTNMLIDCPAGNYSYGFYSNGTWKCRADEQGAGGGNYLGYYNSSLINSTELEEQTGGILGIKLSWLITFFDNLFGGKTTDDLIEGSNNKYDNQSWNQSLADSLYQDTDTFNTTIEMQNAINESGVYYDINTNSSNYWDELNTPADILGSLINNDLNWINTSGGSNLPTKVNLTGGTYNGAITNGTLTGYKAGNNICSMEYSGSHFCDEFEIAQGFSNNASLLLNNTDAWIIAGSPKYIPATVPVNDCNGWMYSGTATYLGNYWHFINTTGGEGRAINCGTALKLACCTY